MKTTLNILILLTISFSASGAVYRFKDNTSINATILEHEYHGPRESGVILKLNNKIYIHHYPAHHKRVDDGQYEPIPAPPTAYTHEINPLDLPVCTPTRIEFMHFSTKTLKKMYFDYHEKVRAEMYKPQPNKNKISRDKGIALAIHKEIHSKKYDLNDKYKVINWERRVVSEFSGNKNVIWGKYIHERHHFSRR
tara:strand:- start:982 stop:1563 length:582 start_codon:yes stop_codon:yes gene_type:complete